MSLPPIIKQAEEKLAGEPDEVLTGLLIVVAVVLVVVALKGKSILKAAVLAWVLMP